ncbi:MAG: hypothetical protein R3280_14210 [Marinobacter sp.]|uniref:hypothetical protein n=1 Tax=Marinobacter sp. TaxID=50741 RepID=UPI00299DA7A0|nr:hypothetical protein [Marinobacter sp.]MDX1635792.1 hypothetical protein [Marinobacter sp.]
MDNSRTRQAGMALVAVLTLPALAQVQPSPAPEAGEEAFVYEERSTVDTIPFRSMAEESLASTVIEGGLEAPAAGVPVRTARSSAELSNEDFYLDPLALQPRDSRTDLGRSEIPVEIRFSNPKVVPGQTWSDNYIIRPPENRTYDTLNTNLTGR